MYINLKCTASRRDIKGACAYFGQSFIVCFLMHAMFLLCAKYELISFNHSKNTGGAKL